MKGELWENSKNHKKSIKLIALNDVAVTNEFGKHQKEYFKHDYDWIVRID